MRILIAGPPKTGNVWLRCLLGSIYDLERLRDAEFPSRPERALFEEWAEQGGFRDGTIFHQHYRYSEEFCRAVEAVPAHLVTIVRDPYDAFVSTYFTIQQRAAKGNLRGVAVDVLAGKPLDHPEVLAFLENDGYRDRLVMANEWAHSGRTVVLRYEELIRDPMGTLTRATDQIAPTRPERIASAVEMCSAENMRPRRHVRVATVGDSRNHLGEQHLRIFRERYADLIQRLGYEVR